MTSPPPSVAGRAAAACGLGLLLALAWGSALWVNSAEEMEILVAIIFVVMIGIPLGLWLLILTLMLAGRRARSLSWGMTTGLALGIVGALASLWTLSAAPPLPALLSVNGLAVFGIGLYLVLRRADVQKEFRASDEAARSGAVTGLRRVRRRLLTTFVIGVGCAFVLCVGFVVAVMAGAGEYQPPPRPPAIPPTSLGQIGARVPSMQDVVRILVAEGYAAADVREFRGDFSASPGGDRGSPNGSIQVVLTPERVAALLGRSRVGVGEFTFRNEGPCTYYAQPVRGVLVDAHRYDGCLPLSDPGWGYAKRITAELGRP